jgi:hypothetical protein
VAASNATMLMAAVWSSTSSNRVGWWGTFIDIEQPRKLPE